MADLSTLILLMIGIGLYGTVVAKPDEGIWEFEVRKDNTLFFASKTLFAGSYVYLSVVNNEKEDIPYTVHWLLRRSPCAQEYKIMNKSTAEGYLLGKHMYYLFSYPETEFLSSTFSMPGKSGGHDVPEEYNYTEPHKLYYTTVKPEVATKSSSSNKKGQQADATDSQETPGGRRKRAADSPSTSTGTPSRTSPKPMIPAPIASSTKKPNPSHKDHDNKKLVKTWVDGFFLFVAEFKPQKPLDEKMKLKVTIRMSYGNSYLSAQDWPLLIFYGVMGLVYIFYGLFWLVMLACNWRDLLRIQFWIGGVILLGMLEKAVFFAEFENINNTGHSVQGAIVFAELVSCVKRTLARMLVIIVSLGYGIVKPRLGETFPKLLGVGLVFFVLASVEGCLRALDPSFQSKKVVFAGIPLAVMDAVICWWIFSSLLQTTRTLKLRRNVVKLSLYRHFTNTLIFSVIASIVFMVWVMAEHRFVDCMTDWKQLWIEQAFWHLLFSVILFIIMILWRPTVNNQRYAFSPLLDAAEDDLDDDQVLSEAYEGMKMRSTKSQQRNGSPRLKDEKKLEDDLQWVEDNIPSSFTDKVLPALDSDEEIMNTKFEVSKME